jgi:hypothetical protein
MRNFLRSLWRRVHLSATLITKLALIRHTTCDQTSKSLYSLPYTHHVTLTVSTWYQIPDPAHQRPCPALRIISRPALPILLSKTTSRLLSIASWHNSRQLVTDWIFKALRSPNMRCYSMAQKARWRPEAIPRPRTVMAVTRTRQVELPLATIIHRPRLSRWPAEFVSPAEAQLSQVWRRVWPASLA